MMRVALGATLVTLSGCHALASAPTDGDPGDAPLEPVPGAALCVSAGRVDLTGPSSMHVDIGGMRGVVPGDAGLRAELAFVYRGPSSTTAPLASGEVRRQIGLKLRAKDTCNVVYVMWHVDPTPGVFVSVKHNEGQSTDAECGAGGYENLANPDVTQPPPIEANEAHVLRADIDGDVLRVRADGRVIWDQKLPADAMSFDGPSGVRSDNGAFDFELRVPEGARAVRGCSG